MSPPPWNTCQGTPGLSEHRHSPDSPPRRQSLTTLTGPHNATAPTTSSSGRAASPHAGHGAGGDIQAVVPPNSHSWLWSSEQGRGALRAGRFAAGHGRAHSTALAEVVGCAERQLPGPIDEGALPPATASTSTVTMTSCRVTTCAAPSRSTCGSWSGASPTRTSRPIWRGRPRRAGTGPPAGAAARGAALLPRGMRCTALSRGSRPSAMPACVPEGSRARARTARRGRPPRTGPSGPARA